MAPIWAGKPSRWATRSRFASKIETVKSSPSKKTGEYAVRVIVSCISIHVDRSAPFSTSSSTGSVPGAEQIAVGEPGPSSASASSSGASRSPRRRAVSSTYSRPSVPATVGWPGKSIRPVNAHFGWMRRYPALTARPPRGYNLYSSPTETRVMAGERPNGGGGGGRSPGTRCRPTTASSAAARSRAESGPSRTAPSVFCGPDCGCSPARGRHGTVDGSRCFTSASTRAVPSRISRRIRRRDRRHGDGQEPLDPGRRRGPSSTRSRPPASTWPQSGRSSSARQSGRNALLEQRAEVIFVTTAGFRDVPIIQRVDKKDPRPPVGKAQAVRRAENASRSTRVAADGTRRGRCSGPRSTPSDEISTARGAA